MGRYEDALKHVITEQVATTSFIQRRVRCGYIEAARMIYKMEQEGIVGPFDGIKPREVLVKDISKLKLQ